MADHLPRTAGFQPLSCIQGGDNRCRSNKNSEHRAGLESFTLLACDLLRRLALCPTTVNVRSPVYEDENGMNIGELTKSVASATSMSEAEARAALMAVFDNIAGAAIRGEEVSILGFGKFTVKDRPERQGRNPKTGESMTISASKKLAFTVAKALQDKL
jgi:DNA-binding protein HU-beta